MFSFLNMLLMSMLGNHCIYFFKRWSNNTSWMAFVTHVVLLQLTVISRSAIVLYSKFLVAFLCYQLVVEFSVGKCWNNLSLAYQRPKLLVLISPFNW